MVYGFGTRYGEQEMFTDFINHGIAAIGYDRNDAEPLYNLIQSILPGDLIYLKSYPPKYGLYIKAVGLVDSPDIYTSKLWGHGRHVTWLWAAAPDSGGPDFKKMGVFYDAYDNMRRGSVYPEYSPKVIETLIELAHSPNQ